MASELHDALQSLLPIAYASVPESDDSLRSFLSDIFANCRLLIDSVPYPETPASSTAAESTVSLAPSSAGTVPTTRARSASSVSDISASSARAPPVHHPSPAAAAALEKAWGRPLKMAPKDNPLGMGVHRLGGRDGRGAWFARRSVHEGLGFARWKLGLQREFDESMREGQGPSPGVGNVRGIGGERRVVRRVVDGVGRLEVYHLNAQFPGPTSPRDFVEMVLSSEDMLAAKDGLIPRHYLVVSKPCQHDDCPPREGFVRGEYESVEFIREIVVDRRGRKTKQQCMSRSTGDLTASEAPSPHDMAPEAMLDRTRQRSTGFDTSHATASDTNLAARKHSATASTDSTEGRARGKTISFAESRGAAAKGEALDVQRNEAGDADDADDEVNPVEWVMITRSDPGGSVPRFMVERGTPSSIVADASKFLDWAVKKEHSPEPAASDSKGRDAEKQVEEMQVEQPQGHRTKEEPARDGLAPVDKTEQSGEMNSERRSEHTSPASGKMPSESTTSGLISTISSAVATASSTLEAYAPQILINHLPGHDASASNASHRTPSTASSSSTSLDSFASADSYLPGIVPPSTTAASATTATAATTKTPGTDTDALAADPSLAAKRAKIDSKLVAARARAASAGTTPSPKDLERLKRAEERHARDMARLAETRARDLAKDEARRAKEARRAEERARKGRERDEREVLARERDAAREEAKLMRVRVESLMGVMGGLQRENTALVAALGKLEGGARVLAETRATGAVGVVGAVGGAHEVRRAEIRRERSHSVGAAGG